MEGMGRKEMNDDKGEKGKENGGRKEALAGRKELEMRKDEEGIWMGKKESEGKCTASLACYHGKARCRYSIQLLQSKSIPVWMGVIVTGLVHTDIV